MQTRRDGSNWHYYLEFKTVVIAASAFRVPKGIGCAIGIGSGMQLLSNSEVWMATNAERAEGQGQYGSG